MADQKITQFTADSTPTSDDLLVTVNDPSGTPANKKVTIGDLTTNLSGTAPNLTAGTVTTNANLTGDVTSSGNATTIANDVVSSVKLVEAFLRGRLQQNTSNSAPTGLTIQYGWGIFPTGAAGSKTDTVTFPTAFNAAPVVIACAGGDDTAGGTTLGDGKAEDQSFHVNALTITASTFIARAVAAGTWAAGTTVFYQWMAIGTV